MSKLIKPNESTYVNGTSVVNNTAHIVPAHIIQMAEELRNELVRLDLNIDITIRPK